MKIFLLKNRAAAVLAAMVNAWFGEAAAQSSAVKPEKSRLEVAMAGPAQPVCRCSSR